MTHTDNARILQRHPLRTLITRLGPVRAAVLSTAFSVAASVLITCVVMSFVHAADWTLGLSLATFIPAGVAPIVSFTTFRLVHQLDDAETRMRELAATDELTRLPNRRHFMKHAAMEMEHARRHGHPVTILVIDLDHFKAVNDTLGHRAGDDVLRHFGTILANSVRYSDMVARVGGEEFYAILPNSDEAGAAVVARRILDGVGREPIQTVAGPVSTTASIGVARATDPAAEQLEELISCADIALYQVKHGGRNGFAIYRPPSGADAL